MMTVRRIATNPPRICIVDELSGGTIRHDMLALSVEDARRVGRELVEAAEAKPTEGEHHDHHP